MDASLAKNFTLHEDLRLQLLVQAFNAFNHVNLANPDNCIDCQDLNSIGVQNAGTIQGTVANQDGTSMRRLQFGARFSFDSETSEVLSLFGEAEHPSCGRRQRSLA